jgi:hypothetical protein
MTDSHRGLALYRDQLHDAIAHDLAGSRPRTRRRRGLLPATATATVVAATAAVVLLTASSAAGPSAADAAILRHVNRALTGPAGEILHQQAMVSIGNGPAQLYEVWQSTSPPYAYRVIKWGHEGTGTQAQSGLDNPAASLRAAVRSGQATVAATTTYDGVPAYKLTVSGSPDRWVNGTAYVAQSDYHPLMIQSHGETIRYQRFEFLPATAANEQMLTVNAKR